ncbi:MAG: SDR family oxidoreductase [Candidatus Marinimicrobia bacterium]|nr:SDR family oxidoreductase [Candidatus Neomarinimicrobiota bacterium]
MFPEHVLVTGASSGIGRALAEHLHTKGYKVTGTSRDPETIDSPVPGVRYLPLDLADPESITRLAETAGKVDILINNAGQSQIGPLEEVPMERVRSLFEINLFGIVHLTKALLPGMRERQKGTIINLSSMSGVFGVGFTSVYCSTKFALEGISRSLRQEVRDFGIRVVLVEPGYIATGLKQEGHYREGSEYYAALRRFKAIRDAHIEHGADPKEVAEKIFSVLQKKHPEPAYPVGGDAPMLAFLSRLLPMRLIEYFQRRRFTL